MLRIAVAFLVTACAAELAANPPSATPGPSLPFPTALESLTADATSPASLPPSPTPRSAATPVPTAAPPTVAPTVAVPSGTVGVPILYLHRVVEIPADIAGWTSEDRQEFLRYMETPCELAAQLQWLNDHAYTTILPRDLTAYWDDHRALPARPIMITFDDGSADWAPTVLPMLLAHGFTAQFYVTVHKIGVSIPAADVQALVDAGMGIGGHDMDHVQIAGGGVVAAAIDTMRYQVGAAKKALEAQFGVTVDDMAYVGGGYDATLIRVVREAGYKSARSILRGVAQSTDDRYRHRVSRVGVFDDVLDKTIANAMACRLDPAMIDFKARVSGTNPG